MTEPIEPAGGFDFGDEPGATAGYRTYGESFEGEEEPESLLGEPGEETKIRSEQILGEEEPEKKVVEGEPGDDEPDPDLKEDDHGLPAVSKELEEERKNLLRMVSDKMKGVGALRIKAQLVDAIDQNPEATIKFLAQKYGVDLGGTPAAEPSKEVSLDFEAVELAPKSGEDIQPYVARLVQANLKPVVDGIKQLLATPKAPPAAAPTPKASAQVPMVGAEGLDIALKHLNENYTDWGIYEDRMVELVTKYPVLMTDPDELYKLAKATSTNLSDVSKAKKGAKKKAKMERPSKVVKIRSGKGKKLEFLDAWELAKRDLRSKS